MTTHISPETLEVRATERSAFEHIVVWRSVTEGYEQVERTFSPVSTILDSDFEVDFVLEDDGYGEFRNVTKRVVSDAMDREEETLRDEYDSLNPGIQFREYLWANSKFKRSI